LRDDLEMRVSWQNKEVDESHYIDPAIIDWKNQEEERKRRQEEERPRIYDHDDFPEDIYRPNEEGKKDSEVNFEVTVYRI